ncbi:MAG: enterotoxin, partial [Ginsengibacter sp.]
VTPKGQLRRGFLYYVERERAHPYRPFLHYNSWYDLSWIDRKMNDSLCLDRIKMYGDSLITKRKVKMKSFLFDDGWDDNASLWKVNKFFPEGFTNMKSLAESYGSQLGLWLSPWGGYDSAKLERLKYGRLQNPPFETNENGFSLAGPVYFKRFEKVTTDFLLKDKVSMFKFDGVGAGNGASGAGLQYQKDIEALLMLINKLRSIEPDLYLSLTVGTWPSVYWLNYGDAIWRAGEDFGLTGSGSKRQQWITYRDAESYKNIVQRAPLFPLNSVMLHGICITNVGYPASLEMDLKNISDGIWSFFASGTSVQELYINPHLLTPPMWDCLATAATWSHDNADVLKDVHWIEGDPGKGEVYGYASWSPGKGIFSLRNPSSVKKTVTINLKDVFELPLTTRLSFRLQNIISPKDELSQKEVVDEKAITITLNPYELKIFEAIPTK